MTRIGVQAMMLKDELENGLFDTLRRVREIGYRSLEISQIPLTAEAVTQLARARDELDLHVPCITVALTKPPGSDALSLQDDFDQAVALADTLGARMFRLPVAPLDALYSPHRLREFCDHANAIANRLKEHGIGLCYHNHHLEFAKAGGRHLLDIILEQAPLMDLELDVHWVQRGGLDPVTVLHRYASRVALVHLKDYRVGELPAEVLRGDHGAGTLDEAMMRVVQFAEVGDGNLDIRSIVLASEQIGVGHLFVEQDLRYGRTALECLETSHDNLVSLGFGHLF